MNCPVNQLEVYQRPETENALTLTINGTPLTLTGLEGRTATIDCEARTTYMEVEDTPEEEPTEEETEGEGIEGEGTEGEGGEETLAEETPTEQPETPSGPVSTHLEPVVTHGDYAVLSNEGTTTIEWTTGVTSLKIYPRWRWF